MAKEYREKVESELRDICHDVLVSSNQKLLYFSSMIGLFYFVGVSQLFTRLVAKATS